MKKSNMAIAAGLLLILAALALVSYNLWDDHRAGAETQAVLQNILPEIETDPIPIEGRRRHRHTEEAAADVFGFDVFGLDGFGEDEIEYPDYVLDPNMDMPVQQIDGHNYIGVLSIPAIGRELPIFDEWSYPNLKIAPCRYVGSAYLDNMVICAHNYEKHFGLLKDLSYGDHLTFTDMDGNVFAYQVIEIETLKPEAIEKMIRGDWDLTLFTCTKGGATRVTVRCERV